MGTDKKVTAKDIKITPGPGHHIRTDEQYPRTFHHATKLGSQQSPNFSFKAQTLTDRSQTDDDIADTKRHSLKLTQKQYFGTATGQEQFFDTMMSGFSQKKIQQPPMLVGKAKVPSDLACVLNAHKTTRPQQNKTIEHNRRNSFVNNSINDLTNQFSPLLVSPHEPVSARVSITNKKDPKERRSPLWKDQTKNNALTAQS